MGIFSCFLPPAASCVSPGELLSAARRLKALAQGDDRQGLPSPTSGGARQALEQILCQEFQVPVAYYLDFQAGSGSAALFLIFKALAQHTSKRVIALAAYTCPDLATAAVCAGFKILPIDINPRTLELDSAGLSAEELDGLAAIVLANLYGLPDLLSPWLALAETHGFIVIDDACQSALSGRRDGINSSIISVGATPGTIGVLSFGRGKAFAGIGGGAVLISGELLGQSALTKGFSETLRQLLESHQFGATNREPFFQQIWGNTQEFARGFCQWLLAKRFGYWFPAQMPFLGLGKTEYKTRVSMRNRQQLSCLYAAASLFLLPQLRQSAHSRAQLWANSLEKAMTPGQFVQFFLERGSPWDGSVVFNRYPVRVKSPLMRETLLPAVRRFGLVSSYPCALFGYPALAPSLLPRRTPGADEVAATLMTLPVHRGIRDSDIAAAVQALALCNNR